MIYVRVFRGLYILFALPPVIIVWVHGAFNLSDFQIDMLVSCAGIALMCFAAMLVCAAIDCHENPNA